MSSLEVIVSTASTETAEALVVLVRLDCVSEVGIGRIAHGRRVVLVRDEHVRKQLDRRSKGWSLVAKSICCVCFGVELGLRVRISLISIGGNFWIEIVW